MKYVLNLFISQYVQMDGDWKEVEVNTRFKFIHWDDVQNTIAYLVEGAEGRPVKFEIRTKEEENGKA